MRKIVYCHFSFKRKREDKFGYFAVAFFRDYNAKDEIVHFVNKQRLWLDHQWVTSIQSYENVLRTIHNCQGALKANGYTDVILVTDNSVLAGWIENPRKNKRYQEYMEKAIKDYRIGASKEIQIGVGLSDVWKYEKSYKYCFERYCKKDITEVESKDSHSDNKLHLLDIPANAMSIMELEEELNNSDTAKPAIKGLNK